ncbi:hypothetical protein NSK_008654 [Nannochloropsis salina CCMP1776]|uniref:Fructose-1,6-bisphosphatase, cytosolic n=2 Tax=Monodopsidaceae TaxID=425072 RepID=W7TP29_9STRA|nr:fructose- -bisphosphatase [Nannochloropsis gaditana]TFJ80097.1 hypothetical protein NSK_008654 [Nannochloropsis salina CCMP1776]|eukprot:TFJ80097.1 hypothetical protein NSK_008654 [Nannochloropsis salina CCMP1776]
MATKDIDNVGGDTDTKTLQRFIISATKDIQLTLLMTSIQMGCKSIARAVRKAGIAGLYGLHGSENVSGDQVKKLDVLSDEIFVNCLKESHCCAVLVSEERDDPIIVEAAKAGKYCVAFDPLDGSSNIDCNVSTGTIFAIYERISASDQSPSVTDILRAGTAIVAAGYCMYGSATDLVLTFGHGVHRFTLDPTLGEFIHTQGPVKLPAKPKHIYSCNEGNYSLWDDAMRAAVDAFKHQDPPYAARYVGSMVSDVHRTLLYGGIFLYPADRKSKIGKLRVLYEGFPMAKIVEDAGGIATTGLFQGKIQRVLDLHPSNVHDRCPIILGTPSDVQRVLDVYAQVISKAATDPKPKELALA